VDELGQERGAITSAAVAGPEFAAGIDRYTRPALIGSLAGAFSICVALSTRLGRAELRSDKTEKKNS
jgi:hypothetical protein